MKACLAYFLDPVHFEIHCLGCVMSLCLIWLTLWFHRKLNIVKKYLHWFAESNMKSKYISLCSLGRGVVGQGRLYRERAGGALHAKEVSNPEKEILQGGELNSNKTVLCLLLLWYLCDLSRWTLIGPFSATWEHNRPQTITFWHLSV